MTLRRPEPARQTSLRAHNLALVLAEVADAGPISRARIAAATGLTKASVSSLVETLATGGLLAELGPSPQGSVGRPGSSIGLAPDGPVGIGLELNVDYLATCTVDLSGAVLDHQLIPTELRTLPEARLLTAAAAALQRAVERAPSRVAGVVVAVPGLVEVEHELLRLAPNLGWRDVPVLAELRRGAGLPDGPAGLRPDPDGLPMRLENEANLAALAELWCGGHRTPDDDRLTTFVHVSGEIGVGAGIVIGGRLFRGARGFGGELGHLPVRADGPECRCGAVGCLEQAAGLEAILRAAQPGTRPAQPGTRPAAPELGPLGPEAALVSLVARATAGVPEAVTAIERAGGWLGIAIASLLNIVDVDAVILGGIYARLSPWLRHPVEAELSRRVLTAGWAPPRVYVSRLGAEAAVRGAAVSVVRAVIADPGSHLAPRPGSA